ncbi:MAG TPA: class I SAM-dependent methyltransferase [Allocoleopsis sp.]
MKQWLLRSIMEVLIGKQNQRLYDAINWQQESDRFRQPDLQYPSYYISQNFHGIAGGYLNAIAPITYDAITTLASPPNERWIRQQLITAIQENPQQILDLGCGTGTSTLMLKQAFPEATVIGLDVSPYMLVVAAHKAQQAALSITWQHGLAETTDFPSHQFDVVTASFLFHETPPNISGLILKECLRLLKPGGQVLILDGNQQILRHADWLIQLFREPYSKVYAQGNTQTWMTHAGFEAAQTTPIGWIHQLTLAVKSCF